MAQALIRAVRPADRRARRPTAAAPSARPAPSTWPSRWATGSPMILDGGPCTVGVESTVLDLTTAHADPAAAGRRHARGDRGGDRPDRAERRPAEGDTAAQIARPARRATTRRPGRCGSTRRPVAGDEGAAGVRPRRRSAGARLTLNLSPAGDLAEAAANLFAHLRALDRPDIGRIAVMPIPQTGLGLAINDRLRRAAADDGSGRHRLSCCKSEETCPTTSSRPNSDHPRHARRPGAAARHRRRQGPDRRRAGQAAVRHRLARLAGRQRRRRGAAGNDRGSLEGREALLRQRHRHRAAGRQHRPDGRRHAVADAYAASCCRSAA